MSAATYIERYNVRIEPKSKISHTTAKGETVTVGDLVIYWSHKIGIVTSIKKDFGRWRVFIHFLEAGETGDYTPSYYASNFGEALRHANPNTINEG